MTCHTCGVPSLSRARDGNEYCHAHADWKYELQVHRDSKPKDAKGWPK